MLRSGAVPNPGGELVETSLSPGFDDVQLGEHAIDVRPSPLQLVAAGGDPIDEQLQLSELARGRVVHVDDLADLGEGEADALAAQDEPQPGAVAGPIDATGATSHRRQQPLGLVPPQGAGGQVEFGGEVRDGVLRLAGNVLVIAGHAATLVAVDVNVK